MGVLFADSFALEGRAVGDGDGHPGNLNFTAAHLERALHHGLVRHVRHDVLVGGYPRGKDLRNGGVGDYREAVVKRSRGCGVFFGVHLAQGEHEGEDAVLVVAQVGLEIARPHSAEGERRAVCEAEGVDERRYILPEGNKPRLPSKLHALLGELLGELPAICPARHEHIEVLLLKLAGNFYRRFVGGRGACYRRKSGRGAVHKLDAALAHYNVARRAQPYPIDRSGPREIPA
ncbi:MAG: hypothetical protein BWY96_02964 [Spirochaetes bacterium ADurb.BinA120]|nr:MAG: hypothetical protein BWY96_02964 [Spirochaetes bacterium ADurb.BinA120]